MNKRTGKTPINDLTGDPGEALRPTMRAGARRHHATVPGPDVAGVVDAVGPAVTRSTTGDEVFGIARGSFPESAAAQGAMPAVNRTLSLKQSAVVPSSALIA